MISSITSLETVNLALKLHSLYPKLCSKPSFIKLRGKSGCFMNAALTERMGNMLGR